MDVLSLRSKQSHHPSAVTLDLEIRPSYNSIYHPFDLHFDIYTYCRDGVVHIMHVILPNGVAVVNSEKANTLRLSRNKK